MSIMEKEIEFQDDDLSRIPKKAYVQQEIYDLEMKKIFQGKTWNLVGHVSEIPNQGDYRTSYIGIIPIVITRDKTNQINVVVNSCAHRSAEVVRSNCGNTKQLQCLYHKWTYDLTGSLKGCPYKEDIPDGVNEEELSLKKLNVQLFHGLIFASFAKDMMPVEEYLGDVTDGIKGGLEDSKLVPIGSHKVIFNCNWKMYSENIYDGYHTGMLHAAFRILRMFAAGGEYTGSDHGSGYYSYKTLPIEDKTVLNDMSVFNKDKELSYIMNIYPNTVISAQLETLTIRYVRPIDKTKTEVQFHYFARESDSKEMKDLRIKQASNVFGPEGIITIEDAVALESVQKSIGTEGDTIILKPNKEGKPPIYAEVGIRDFWKKWRELMEI
jgi:anthranilate 1,2-dioxygenase large subunit